MLCAGQGVGGGAAVEAVDASAISGLQLWLRGDVGFSGASWTDLSGNSHAVTQSTPANRATASTFPNGRACAAFDRSIQQWFRADTVASVMSGTDKACTVVAAIQSPLAALHRVWASWGKDGAPADTPAFWCYHHNDNLLAVVRNDNLGQISSLTSALAVDSGPHVVAFVVASTTAGVFLDGVSIASGALDVGTSTFDRFAIGAKIQSSATSSFDGKIAELAIYDRALTTAERRAVERKLRQRWGTP